MAAWQEIVEQVRARANQRCEYCQMQQSLQGATFHIEHVVPKSIGGASDLDNLALACPSCNLHKSDRTQANDPVSGAAVPLFNPRINTWTDHFSWNEFQLEGRTEIGRATIIALHLNTERRLSVRQAEESLRMFPP
jgi:5-methylcytosine-specific restriction endonuclease McrA